jgi:hypothetical protein
LTEALSLYFGFTIPDINSINIPKAVKSPIVHAELLRTPSGRSSQHTPSTHSGA